MRVFVAGATGALGRRVVSQLTEIGVEVFGLTRSGARARIIEHHGGEAIVGDALDRDALITSARDVRPDVVVHALTAIPKRGPLRPSDMLATNRLRRQGTVHLLDAAIEAGARRVVAESMVFVYGFGDHGNEAITEGHPLQEGASSKPWLEEAVQAVRALEAQLHDRAAAGAIEGVILRFGLFYGLGAGAETMARLLRRRLLPIAGDGSGVASWIHVDDAAAAVVAAIHRGRSGEAYNVVDDEPVRYEYFLETLAKEVGASRPLRIPRWIGSIVSPFLQEVLDSRLRVSNEKAKSELEWAPRFPNYRQGLGEIGRQLRRAKSAGNRDEDGSVERPAHSAMPTDLE